MSSLHVAQTISILRMMFDTLKRRLTFILIFLINCFYTELNTRFPFSGCFFCIFMLKLPEYSVMLCYVNAINA